MICQAMWLGSVAGLGQMLLRNKVTTSDACTMEVQKPGAGRANFYAKLTDSDGQQTVRKRSWQITITSSGSRFHQFLLEKISASTKPA